MAILRTSNIYAFQMSILIIPTTSDMKDLVGNQIWWDTGFIWIGEMLLMFLVKKRIIWFCNMLDWMDLIHIMKCRIGV